MASATLIILPILLFCLISVQAQLYDDLFNKLMTRYKSHGSQYTLPVNSKDDVVHVNVSMTLVQLTSMDTETGDAVLEAWMGYHWRDRRLKWNVDRHDGVEALHIPGSFIWKPDIVMYNGHVSTGEFEAVVNHDGGVMYIPQSTIKVRCDLTNYTTDNTVTCKPKFGSWTYHGKKISPHLTGESQILAEFAPTDGWEAVSAEGQRRETKYDCCPETYPDLLFTLTFRRQSSSWLNVF